MSGVSSADLEGQLERLGPFELVRAEWWRANSRFVTLRYRMRGELAELGLRMDLDKQAILDHLDNAELDRALQGQATRIWRIVAPQVARERLAGRD